MARLTLPRIAPPPVGAQLYVYEAGTVNEVSLYSDSGFATPVAQPVTLGSSNLDLYTNGNFRVDLKFVDPIYTGGFAIIPDQILFDHNEEAHSYEPVGSVATHEGANYHPGQNLETTDTPTFNNLILTNGYLGHKIQSDSVDQTDRAKLNFKNFVITDDPGADAIDVEPYINPMAVIELPESTAGQTVWNDARIVSGKQYIAYGQGGFLRMGDFTISNQTFTLTTTEPVSEGIEFTLLRIDSDISTINFLQNVIVGHSKGQIESIAVDTDQNYALNVNSGGNSKYLTVTSNITGANSIYPTGEDGAYEEEMLVWFKMVGAVYSPTWSGVTWEDGAQPNLDTADVEYLLWFGYNGVNWVGKLAGGPF